MDTQSVIVAVASPPGHSLRGIVRMSGDGCAELARAVAACATPAPPSPSHLPRGIHRARLRAPAPECPCLVLSMPGPASSTGEDCVEIHAAGNPMLLERIVQALLLAANAGSTRGTRDMPAARRALPGEFSARAVLNGRMSMEDADRVAHAVAAATDAQLSAANAIRTHARGAQTAAQADAVATLLALVEAGIDFTDQEDVCAIAPGDLARRTGEVAQQLEAAATSAAGAEVALSAPLVLLAGPPNAGKSSLFNALLGRARTVASPHAGTTRDVVCEPLPLPEGSTVLLADAPGLDDGEHALDVLVRQRAEEALRDADVVLWCAPVNQRMAPLPDVRGTVLAVRTMCDAGGDAAGDVAAESTRPEGILRHALLTSAHTGRGLDALAAGISQALRSGRPSVAASKADVGSLQGELARSAAAALRQVQRLAQDAPTGARQLQQPEILAAALREALDRLGEVAGAIPPDDVLGRLFAKFCVGK